MRQGQGSIKNHWGERPITVANAVACVNPPHTALEQVQGNQKGRRRRVCLGCARDRGRAVAKRGHSDEPKPTPLSTTRKRHRPRLQQLVCFWLEPSNCRLSLPVGCLLIAKTSSAFPRLQSTVSVLVPEFRDCGSTETPRHHHEPLRSTVGRFLLLKVETGADGSTTGQTAQTALPRFATPRRNTRRFPCPMIRT